jgi:hypothetical protein
MMLDKIKAALEGRGFQKLVRVTPIDGPGNMVVVYWTAGDARVACLNRDYGVVWDETCGGSEPENCYQKRKYDEPVFTLMARDPQAPLIIDLWADDRMRLEGSVSKVVGARRIAEDMRIWKTLHPDVGMAAPPQKQG